MPDATPPRPLTAPDVVAGLLADVADARAQLAEARKAFAKLAGHFTQGKQSGWTARISGTVLRRLCAMAGCGPPSGSDAPGEAALSLATQGAHAIGEVAYCGFTAAKGGERICWEALDPAERQRWQQSATAVLARARAGLDAP